MKKVVTKSGFTLIELLVVISIIGLLSSVVLASLNSARQKARDAAVVLSVKELSKLLALEYSDNNNYNNLQRCQWVPISGGCDSAFIGAYASQAIAMCKTIIKNAPQIWGTPGYSFLLCNPLDNGQKFSVMATLSDIPYFFCAGSSGVSNHVFYWTNSSGQDIQGNPSLWSQSPIGCYYNP